MNAAVCEPAVAEVNFAFAGQRLMPKPGAFIEEVFVSSFFSIAQCLEKCPESGLRLMWSELNWRTRTVWRRGGDSKRRPALKTRNLLIFKPARIARISVFGPITHATHTQFQTFAGFARLRVQQLTSCIPQKSRYILELPSKELGTRYTRQSLVGGNEY